MIIKKQGISEANVKTIIDEINKGNVVVLPTDTIYGLHATIKSDSAVNKVYKLKGRQEKKPFIILINKIADIENLGISISDNIKTFLKKIWPGKVSVVFTDSLAFRMPKNKLLSEIISKTGPIISTSVNPSGKKPARSIDQAIKYFGKKIDLYIDDGDKKSSPSTLIEISGGNVKILRQGSVKISSI